MAGVHQLSPTTLNNLYTRSFGASPVAIANEEAKDCEVPGNTEDSFEGSVLTRDAHGALPEQAGPETKKKDDEQEKSGFDHLNDSGSKLGVGADSASKTGTVLEKSAKVLSHTSEDALLHFGGAGKAVSQLGRATRVATQVSEGVTGSESVSTSGRAAELAEKVAKPMEKAELVLAPLTAVTSAVGTVHAGKEFREAKTGYDKSQAATDFAANASQTVSGVAGTGAAIQKLQAARAVLGTGGAVARTAAAGVTMGAVAGVAGGVAATADGVHTLVKGFHDHDSWEKAAGTAKTAGGALMTAGVVSGQPELVLAGGVSYVGGIALENHKAIGEAAHWVGDKTAQGARAAESAISNLF